MDLKKSRLFGLSSLSELEELLGIGLSQFYRSENLWRQYHIQLVEGVRIIEAPNNKLKQVQRLILSLLYELDYPDYLYSVRGRSFVDGTASHIRTANHIIKMDIHKFFLSTGREKVYRFWKETMQSSLDVAVVLTNLTTVDLRFCSITEVTEFLKKNRLCMSHLGFGVPTSIVLSFLCNLDMFTELEQIALKNEMTLSVFVDDIVLSGEKNINRTDFDSVRTAIMGHGYKINRKSKYQNSNQPIVVTGLYLSRKGLGVPNNKQKEFIELTNCMSVDSENNSNEKRSQGLRNYISSILKVNSLHKQDSLLHHRSE